VIPHIPETTLTLSGVHFNITDNTTWKFNQTDITYGLTNICRFGGQLKSHYSVAEHSQRVANTLKEWGTPPDVQLLGLLHDATEAYMLDIPSPWKQHVKIKNRLYTEIEHEMMKAIVDWESQHNANIQHAWANDWDLIEAADQDAYQNETHNRPHPSRRTHTETLHGFTHTWQTLRNQINT
jgi:uncharacterized protein